MGFRERSVKRPARFVWEQFCDQRTGTRASQLFVPVDDDGNRRPRGRVSRHGVDQKASIRGDVEGHEAGDARVEEWNGTPGSNAGPPLIGTAIIFPSVAM
jgi:hypothetical protein